MKLKHSGASPHLQVPVADATDKFHCIINTTILYRLQSHIIKTMHQEVQLLMFVYKIHKKFYTK